jgi:hypothetical protein
MAVGTFVLFTIIFIIFAALATWLIIVVYREKNIEINRPWILNFSSARTKGRFIGKSIDNKIVNNRPVIFMDARDLIPKKNKKKIEPETIKVNAGKNKVVRFPKGSLSRDCDIEIVLPAKLSDLDEYTQQTSFGKALLWASAAQNFAETQIQILERSCKDRDSLLKKINDGEITREWQKFNEEMIKDILRAQAIAKEEKSKSSLQFPTQMTAHNE